VNRSFFNVLRLLKFVLTVSLQTLTCYSFQIKQLNFQGYEVILVTSGAVGVGRQRLQYRKLIHSRLQRVWLRLLEQFVAVY
jgi:glutamate 5-kinase